jgi:hypothetical protein
MAGVGALDCLDSKGKAGLLDIYKPLLIQQLKIGNCLDGFRQVIGSKLPLFYYYYYCILLLLLLLWLAKILFYGITTTTTTYIKKDI